MIFTVAQLDQNQSPPAISENGIIPVAQATGPLLWIGLGLVVLLLLFLMLAYLRAGRGMRRGEHTILHVLSSSLAGFAAGLMTGGALMHFETPVGTGGKLVIDAIAGFVLFFVVWWFFPKYEADQPPPQDGVSFTPASGWTFETTLDALAKRDKTAVNFVGFTSAELAATIQSRQIDAETIEEAMASVRSITTEPNAIRPYSVGKASQSIFLVRII